MERRPLSPLTLLGAAWLLPLALYGFRLSSDFERPLRQPVSLILLVLISLAVPFAFFRLDWILRERPLRLADLAHQPDSTTSEEYRSQARTVARLFKAWWAVAIAEMVLEGEIPAVTYLVTGRGDYRNFGIPTVHGAILAGALALTILSYTVGRSSPANRWLLKYAVSLPVYSLLTFARKGLIVTMIFIVLYELSTSQFSLARIRRLLPFVLAVFLLFTLVGNSRTGGPAIHERARIHEGFEGLPSGVIWVYMYVASPLENLSSLVYDHEREDASIGVGNTFGNLNPLAEDDAEGNSTRAVNASRYWLTNSAFNVSTGIEPIYRDGGFFLIAAITGTFSATVAFLYYRRPDRNSLKIYLLLLTIGVLQIFSNNLGNLNVVAAFPVLVWFSMRYPRPPIPAPSPKRVETLASRVGATA